MDAITDRYDTIVAGAGIAGSATAYTLAKQGKRTLLVDQFTLPHTRGSSHGQSRQIRSLYENQLYIPLTSDAYRGWKMLEEEEGTTLFIKTGSLCTGKRDQPEVNATYQTMKQCGIQAELITSSQMKSRFKGIAMPNDFVGVFDPEGGILKADICLHSFWNQFRKHGGIIKDRDGIAEITSKPDGVLVKTRSGKSYFAKTVVLCLGPWTKQFLKPMGLSLPLKSTNATCYYARCKNPVAYSADHGFPTMNVIMPNGDLFFSWPSYECPGFIKIGLHDTMAYEADPNRRDVVDMQNHKDKVKRFFGTHWTDLDPELVTIEQCMYTMTPDCNFIIDRHPKHSNIIIGAGFSGHGFKFAPVIGRILSELANDARRTQTINEFSIERFNNPIASASRL